MVKKIPDPTQDATYQEYMSREDVPDRDEQIALVRDEMTCTLDSFYIKLDCNQQSALDEALLPFAEAIYEQREKDKKYDY